MIRQAHSRYATRRKDTRSIRCMSSGGLWSTLQNGVLLVAAEQAGYDLFITTDQNVRYRQNLTGRSLAILVLKMTSWPKMQPHVHRIRQTIDVTQVGSYHELSFDQSP